ncbi:hypothetical protein [Desertibaculum subflavum]|uniref:hypothetical protein n=1 Tax=Desertibaculum subflavum TaxID=2268458 RepID=UPI0013C3F293
MRWGALGVGLLLLLAAGSMTYFAFTTGERIRWVDPNDVLFLDIQRIEEAPRGSALSTLVHGRVDGEQTPVTLKLTGFGRSGRFVGERLPVYATGMPEERFVAAFDYHSNLPLWHIGGAVVAAQILGPAAIAAVLGGILLWLSRLARRAAAHRAARRPARAVAAPAHQAMRIDIRAVPPVCRMIADRLVATDRRDAAGPYLDRAAAAEEIIAAAEDERRLTVADSFAPHGMPPEAVRAVASTLAGRPELRSAWLVRKRLTHFAEIDPFFVLAVEIRGWRAKRRQASLAWLGDNIVLPGRGVITMRARDSRWLFRRLQRDGMVPIYQNL